ncbi:MAG TPA: mechanosensitive ion channel domain-containing protein [Candidatus Nanoarchaeia archaeon]|nr:mechanosensitive ion channel domain-containing protein [Candidatus Nanoarchaeia archaeon]
MAGENISQMASEASMTFFNIFSSRFVIAILLLLIGLAIGKFTEKIVRRLLHELELDNILSRISGRELKIEKALSLIVSFFIYFIAVIIALNELGITTKVLFIIAAAILVIAAVSFALAVKDFIPNFFAGLYIMKNKVIIKGERVRLRGMEGVIREITFLETRIKADSGDEIHIPNASVIKSEIVKLSKNRSAKKRR